MELSGDQLSAIFGWISMGSWIIVYSPQIIANYRNQSGDGLSILFLMGWAIGDVCSVSGGIIGGLVPSVVWLGVYHLSSDLFVFAQVLYYRWKRSRYPIGPLDYFPTPNPSTSALTGETRYETYDYEYDYNHTNYDSDIENTPLLRARRKLPEDGTLDSDRKEGTLSWVVIKCVLSLVGISLCGIAAWWVNEMYFGPNVIDGGSVSVRSENASDWGDLEWLREPIVQVLGWTVATLFIGSNIPQIFKNLETRCEGLSPGLFVFSAFGSCTYVASILAKSFERDYIFRNAGWLAGHGIACFLDFVIIGQVIYYQYTERGRRGSYSSILLHPNYS